ncbi:MAG TPA: NB-ARC domain-containing protein [Ktedonobacteraceae bacterium]
MSTFSERLEALRIQKHISKKDLAQQAGLTASYVSLLTRGDRTAPSRQSVRALAQALALGEQETQQLFELAGYPDAPAPIEAVTMPGAQDPPLPQTDWGQAPDTSIFYGRQQEQARLKVWIEDDACRLVAVLGIGGIGKTALASRVARSLQTSFVSVFWRSLQDAPPLESVLRECVQFLTDQKSLTLPREKERWLPFLIEALLDAMRTQRCLIVLDNFESVLQQGERTGQYRAGYEGYARLLHRIGETSHRGCLLLTSREKPREIVQLEGLNAPVRSYVLLGVNQADGQELLKRQGIFGSQEAWALLISRYSGNPLALKLIAELILELFRGSVAAFLQAESVIVGDMLDLLDQQFRRLPVFEKEIMYWLAIEREPVSLAELRRNILRPVFERVLMEGLDSLRRRSIIETVGAGRFTLQPVIMEYVTGLFVQSICQEIDEQQLNLFESHTLLKAQAKDYIRERQARFILEPIKQHVLATCGLAGSEQRFQQLLEHLRQARWQALSYAAGNLLNLLIALGVELCRYDFSSLPVWQAYLQEIHVQGINFASADLASSVFTDTFDSTLSVAVSADGKSLAAGTADSEIRLWSMEDGTLEGVLKGHTDWVRSISIDQTSTLLASGSEDQTVRLWDLDTRRCQAILRGHTGRVYAVAFSPAGTHLASASEDQTVRLWEVASRTCLRVYREHTNRVWAVSFSPDTTLLASNSEDQTIRIWDIASGRCLKVLEEQSAREEPVSRAGHITRIWSVTFSPNGKLLASGGREQAVLLWDVESGQQLKALKGHSNWIRAVAFSPNGRYLASSSDDTTVRLWEVESGQALKTLEGHVNRVRSLAFSPDSQVLVTGGDDQTINQWEVHTGRRIKRIHGNITRTWCVAFNSKGNLLACSNEDRAVRLWDVRTGQCLSVLREHTNWARSVAFSPDGQLLATGGEDQLVRIWHLATGSLLKIFPGHTSWIYGVTFDPTGSRVASCSEDQTVCLWDLQTGQPTIVQNFFDWVRSIAFAPSGELLASGGEDQKLRLWDVRTGQCLHTLEGHTDGICAVAINPAGTLVASGSEDQTVRIWDLAGGQCLSVLHKKGSYVRSVAFSPGGDLLASGGDDEKVSLWDVAGGTCVQELQGHVKRVSSVAFSPDGQFVASGGYDGTLKLWDVSSGSCVRTLSRTRPYEGMNIANVRGLTLAQKSALHDLGAVEIQLPDL